MEETFQGQTFKVKKTMPLRRKLLLAVFILLCILLLLFIAREIYDIGYRRGIAGIRDPIQTPAEGRTHISSFFFNVNVTYEYAYDIEGLVVHTRRYFGFGKMSDAISPMDVGLAWGRVAEYNDRIDFHWSQSGRYCSWHVDDIDELMPVGDVENVERSASNNHIIPADDRIKRTVLKIRRGDRVKLEGYLVDVKAADDKGNTFTWNSSTTRTDTGDGACELIYVTKAEIVK